MTVLVLIFWQYWMFQCNINLDAIDNSGNDIRIECIGTCTKSNAANCENFITPDSNAIIVKIYNQSKDKIGIYCDQSLGRVSPEIIKCYLKDSIDLKIQFTIIGEPNLRNLCYLTPGSTRCFSMYFANFGNCNYYEANIPIRFYDDKSPYDRKVILSFSKDCIE